MSKVPVPVVHPYSNDPENTAGIAVEYTYKTKILRLHRDHSLRDEGS